MQNFKNSLQSNKPNQLTELRENLRQIQLLLPEALLQDHIRIGQRIEKAIQRFQQGLPVTFPINRWKAQIMASIGIRKLRSKLLEKLSYPSELPITAKKDEIIETIRSNQVIIISGETGCGKSTQLPKMCLEAGLGQRGRIGCTQPRRIAAISISQRIAEELGVEWGREVGCKIRFMDHCQPETSIKVMTDGILLAELRTDPLLIEYDAIIIDEAHERSLNIEFLLGYFRQLIHKRPDLKLLISSATLETELFANAFNAPVIEIPTRLYPVQIRYKPINAQKEPQLTYVEAAAEAVLEIVQKEAPGDILIFMPTERDISDTCDLLHDKLDSQEIEILPLFSRLTATEQQRIFRPSKRLKIIVATNIAETSLTIPGIKYVIDTGLARISRYHHGMRTLRLPIEPISQSSANQRTGRCGRTEGGVCIRLYSEEDFNQRPRFTEPEILRVNLADVVLRMKAYQLGDIETFPFLQPPSLSAIKGAYVLLEELGAIDNNGNLTPLGKELAYLPVDPIVGRMLLEARKTRAVSELLIIAAGISIQDPREYPFTEKELAVKAHKRFQDPSSDFLTYLNIWNQFQKIVRKAHCWTQVVEFCKRNYLSYQRMREWNNLYLELKTLIEELGGFYFNTSPAPPSAIHKCILSGLIGNIGKRIGPNLYEGTSGKKLVIFPTSALWLNKETKTSFKQKEYNQPEWIVAATIMETHERFACIAGQIDPKWIEELAPNLCKKTYIDPFWDEASGRVLIREQTLFRGLLLRQSLIPYGRIHPERANEIFIEEALLGEKCNLEFEFIKHNRRLYHKLEFWQSRRAATQTIDLYQRFFEFYKTKLPHVNSIEGLRAYIREKGESHLLATEKEILGENFPLDELNCCPDRIAVGEDVIEIFYFYEAGSPNEGVLLKVNIATFEKHHPQFFEWIVPIIREERILYLLQLFPKSVQKRLEPLPETANKLAQQVPFIIPGYLDHLWNYLKSAYGIEVPKETFVNIDYPNRLKPIVEVIADSETKPVACGRDLDKVKMQAQQFIKQKFHPIWIKRAYQLERYNLQSWSFDDQPDKYLLGQLYGIKIYAYPGLHAQEDQIHLKLFESPDQAYKATKFALPILAQKELSLKLMEHYRYLSKALKEKVAPLYISLGPVEKLINEAWTNLIQYTFHPPSYIPPLQKKLYETYLKEALTKTAHSLQHLIEMLYQILSYRQKLLLIPYPYPGMLQELNALVPPHFLRIVPFEMLHNLVRYLQAIEIRVHKARSNPKKYFENSKHIQQFVNAYTELVYKLKSSPQAIPLLNKLRWLIEEYKVNCFAPQLKAHERVSETVLIQLIDDLRKLLPRSNNS